jgi:hypothetical protein
MTCYDYSEQEVEALTARLAEAKSIMESALFDMRHTVAPRASFTDTVERLSAFLDAMERTPDREDVTP